jgi:LuxR family maltose regulon positive regulatory protein
MEPGHAPDDREEWAGSNGKTYSTLTLNRQVLPCKEVPDVAPSLIVTKYTIPPAGSNDVRRARLVEPLLTGLHHKCTLISAPPGFGKSTLAAEAARRSTRGAAWLSLDRGDNDPARFGAYLVAAIRRAGLPLGEPVESLLRLTEQPPLQSLVAMIINAAATIAADFLLVLDDYQAIFQDEIHAEVANLLYRLPSNFRVMIVSRTRPPLPLAWLKARGDLAEITGADLRFTMPETIGFLRETMGLNLPETEIADLFARTEGWVTGLKLAALSLRGHADRSAATLRFSGRAPDLLQYLTDEVVGQQPERVRTFLRESSVLDRLTGPLCDALTGRTDGQQVLQQLEQANLFLVPLEPDRQWYRYHPLFAEFLLARLRDESTDAHIRELHRRAAGWHLKNGQFADAIQHLLQAQAFEEAADCLETAFNDWSPGVSWGTLRAWVEQIPKDVMQQRPRLCTMAAWVLINSEDGLADHLYARTVEYLGLASHSLQGADPAEPAVRESLGVVAAVRTALAPWAPRRQGPQCILQDLAEAVGCAEEARSLLPPGNLFWRSVVSSSLGQVYLRAGNIPGAAQSFGHASRLGSQGGNLTATLAALHRQAQLLMVLGQLSSADKAYREGLRLAAERGGDAWPILAPIYLGLGRLQYEWNDLAAAEGYLAQANRVAEANGAAAPDVLLATARVQQARGNGAAARLLVDQAGDLLAARTKLRAAEWAVWPEGVRILLAQGDVRAARRWVAAWSVSLDGEPVLWRAPEYLALARVAVADGRPEAVRPLLRSLQAIAAAGGCRGLEAEVCLVLAHAHLAAHDAAAARASVHAALQVTMPEEFVRLFADEGQPIITLLEQIGGELTRGQFADAPYRAYVPHLLAMVPPQPAAPAPEPLPTLTAPPPVEPLTERQVEILRLMARGCSNQEIAGELFLGVSTVKWHLLHIFGKLQVKNRTQAVALARQLGLIS